MTLKETRQQRAKEAEKEIGREAKMQRSKGARTQADRHASR